MSRDATAFDNEAYFGFTDSEVFAALERRHRLAPGVEDLTRERTGCACD